MIGLMLDHLSIQCADVAGSAAFYDVALAPLCGQRIMDFGDVIGYGVPPRPEFWLGPRSTGARLTARVMELAQQTVDVAVADAKREAAEILAWARQEAEQIIAEARSRAEQP